VTPRTATQPDSSPLRRSRLPAGTSGLALVPSLPASPIGSLLDLRNWSRLRLLIDLLVLSAASVGAVVGAGSAHVNLWLASAYAVLVAAIMHRREPREDRFKASLFDTLAHVLSSVTLAGVLIIALGAMSGTPHPAKLGLGLWALAGAALAIERTALMYVRRSARRGPALASPTLIVGAGIIGGRLARRLEADRGFGLRPVGFLDADPLPRRRATDDPRAVPVLGAPDDLAAAVAQTGARHVILAFSTEPDAVLLGRVHACEALGLSVSLVPRLYEAINDRATLDHVAGMPLLTLHAVNPRGWQFGLKHAIDRAAALCALMVLAPTMLAIALAVRLDSPGPVLFRQRRVGRDGRPFDMLKFRTMRIDGTGEPFFEPEDGLAPGGIEGEDRRTRVGRILRDHSVDELPQLLNVLRGEMSLVGPRPERPEFTARFSEDVNRYEDRHRVRSGITGWAQVHGLRGQTSIEDRVEWDNYYIQNWSLGLDLQILGLTVAELLRPHDES
jgi:exopolysaccharide biosynthesis polyprenyl glycosylphosphotransferase